MFVVREERGLGRWVQKQRKRRKTFAAKAQAAAAAAGVAAGDAAAGGAAEETTASVGGGGWGAAHVAALEALGVWWSWADDEAEFASGLAALQVFRCLR